MISSFLEKRNVYSFTSNESTPVKGLIEGQQKSSFWCDNYEKSQEILLSGDNSIWGISKKKRTFF